MKATLIIMPSSPALVAELAPQDHAGQRLVSTLKSVLTQELKAHNWPIELIGSRDPQWSTSHSGSLKAWGAPQVKVGAGNYLAEILQRYVLGEAQERVVSVAGEATSISAETLTLVALDGPTGLTPRAPSSLVPGAPAAHQWCQQLLQGKAEPRTAQALFDASLRDPALWLDLYQLLPLVESSELLDVDDTLGVGRYVARWTINKGEK
ncbi:hypothetical protein SFC07_02565 [Corynebacterium callunae]|uniref:hypothetical protein n=1 Tax=Corynebacterium callunae TaxID=1721 RepID=UPI0039826756